MNANIQSVTDTLANISKEIEMLQARINEINQMRPKMEEESQPSNAIKNIVKNISPISFNDNILFWRDVTHTKVVLWYNGIVTTFKDDPNTQNPIAVFKTRMSAIHTLRFAEWNVPSAKAMDYFKGYIIATK